MRAPMRLMMLSGVTALAALGCSSDDSAQSDPTPPASLAESSAPTTRDSEPTPTTDATVGSTTTSTDAPDPTATEPSTTATETSTDPPPSTEAPESTTSEPAPPSTLIPPVPAPLDPDDANNQRVVEPDEEPIVAAYRQAVEAELLTYSRWPLDPESPELVNGPFTARVMEPIRQGIADRTELNQVLDISSGITLRPYVVEDDDGDPNRAFVWDCQIDATFWKDVETGEKAPPDAFPNAGPPGVETGVVAVMVNVDGRWLLDEGALEPQACA